MTLLLSRIWLTEWTSALSLFSPEDSSSSILSLMAKRNTVSVPTSEIQVSKIPFRIDEELVRRAKLEEDVAAIAFSIWQLLSKRRAASGWERAGIQLGVRRLGVN